MSLARSRYVGALVLMVLLSGGWGCASKRPPTYVYTPPPTREAVQAEPAPAVSPTREARESSRPARAETPPARPRTPVTEARTPPPPPAAALPDPAIRDAVAEAPPEQETRRSRFFGRSSGSEEEVQTPAEPVFADLDVAAVEFESPTSAYRLRPNDPLIVRLRGIPEADDYELVVDDRGFIYLPYIPPIRVEGLTPSELQRIIQDTYVSERIYRRVNVNVLLPTQSYFVRGEVRQPGRFPLTSGMTVLKAIAAAGGYTEFANPRRINIIRAGETLVENARAMEQNPEQDMEVKAGDVIIIPRSIF
jgi:polysaccharide biosynthesis/export protein VpsN